MDVLNDILSALSIKIDELYPDIPVYSELVPNKLPSRCFLIGFAGEAAIAQDITGRYRVSGKLDITYLPPQKEDEIELKRELNGVFTRLALNLEAIKYRDLTLRLRGHTRQVAGDVLHDICKFQTFLYRADDTPTMQNITVAKEELK